MVVTMVLVYRGSGGGSYGDYCHICGHGDGVIVTIGILVVVPRVGGVEIWPTMMAMMVGRVMILTTLIISK